MYISIDADVPACINCLHLCEYEDMYTDILYIYNIKVHMFEKKLIK